MCHSGQSNERKHYNVTRQFQSVCIWLQGHNAIFIIVTQVATACRHPGMPICHLRVSVSTYTVCMFLCVCVHWEVQSELYMAPSWSRDQEA